MNTDTATLHNLNRLAILRLVTSMGVAIALMAIGLLKTSELQGFAAWSILLTMCLLSAFNLHRAKKGKLTSYEIFTYLIIDTLLIAGLMFFTGGANNPFITYMLVPIVISAATLSWLSTWLLCMLTMTLYGLLLFFYYPLASLDIQLAELGMSFHIIGMWFTFILSSLLIAYFVVEMAMDLKYQERQTAFFREQSIQNEHVMMLAGQAASTAHEIGNPLTTLKMLNHELSLSDNLSNEDKEDIALMSQQIDICQNKLKQLTQSTQVQQSQSQSLTSFIHDALQQWLLMRPTARYEWDKIPNEQSPTVQYPLVIQQAIINLLDNSMNASTSTSSASIELHLSWNEHKWQLYIQDFGKGVSDNFEIPKEPISSQQGLGIGLMLSHSSIQRLGGHVDLTNNEHGCLTTIELPFYVG
jgi:two-component system sensor histidine kinase RegB